MRSNRIEKWEVQEVEGIPIEWFYEINAACDRFFRKRKMPPSPSFYDTITSEMKLAKRKKFWLSKK